MSWNWQQPGWPAFSWNEKRLRKAEERFLVGTGTFIGTLKHLSPADEQQLTIEAISTEAVTTSEIEGEILNRMSVQSSVRRQFGLAAPAARVSAAERGISEVMVDVYRSFADPLLDDTLWSWHGLMFNGRTGILDIGRYRTGLDPMQVVSGRIDVPRVHFEAPPSKAIPREMARFVKWFNRTAPGGREPLPALTRAGIAHLYFESIHPFEDGNGRIGRAIAEKVLAQSLGQPTLIALAATILAHRKAYYQALEAANRSNEVTAWLAWFAGIAIEAQRRTATLVEFLLDKTRLLDRLRGHINSRQEKVLLRMLREGAEGFKGGLSAGNYATISGASPATTTRDLADLVDQGALLRSGERRHARYHLPFPTRSVSAVVLDRRGDFT